MPRDIEQYKLWGQYKIILEGFDASLITGDEKHKRIVGIHSLEVADTSECIETFKQHRVFKNKHWF